MIIRLLFLVTSFMLTRLTHSTIPTNILSCYKDDTINNRVTRMPMSMDNLIGLIEKVESSDETKNYDISRTTSALLARFRYDGVYKDSSVAHTPYNSPYKVLLQEKSKFGLIKQLYTASSTDFPDDVLTPEEECGMHWMLSYTLNDTKRLKEEEMEGCRNNINNRKKRFIGKLRDLLTGASQSTEQDASSQTTKHTRRATDFGHLSLTARSLEKTGNYETSGCPLEGGVVYTKWGTVAAGTLLAGIAAGLRPEEMQVDELVQSTDTINELDSEIRNQRVNNLWATTIAGDLAQTALIYGVKHSDSKLKSMVGPGGRWNSTACPREYHFTDPDQVSAMTSAEIYGGLDGYLIGQKIRSWSQQAGSTLRLSQILRLYYSDIGVGYDEGYMACNRVKMFKDDSIVDKGQLKQQAMSFAYAYFATEVTGSSIDSDKIQDAVEEFVDEAYKDLSNFLSGSSYEDDWEVKSCREVEPPVQEDGEEESSQLENNLPAETNADVIVVLDTDTDASQLYVLRNIIAELAQSMDVSMFGSNMGLVKASDGEAIIELGNVTNRGHLACQLQDIVIRDTSSVDYMQVLSRLRTKYYAPNKELESQDKVLDGVNRGNAQVLLFVTSASRINDIEDLKRELDQLIDDYPDLIVMGTGMSKSAFDDLRSKLNSPNFATDNIFSLSEAMSNSDYIRRQIVPKIHQRLIETPSRLIYPRCYTLTDPGRSYQEGRHSVVRYVSPGSVLHLKYGPEQFFTSETLKVKFEVKGSGAVKVCFAREAMGGRDQPSCKSSGNKRRVEFEHHFPCGQNGKAGDCRPLFYSVVGLMGTNKPRCTDKKECPFPNSIKVAVTHDGMRCNRAVRGTSVTTLALVSSLVLALLNKMLSL